MSNLNTIYKINKIREKIKNIMFFKNVNVRVFKVDIINQRKALERDGNAMHYNTLGNILFSFCCERTRTK